MKSSSATVNRVNDPVTQYARDVVNGDIVAGPLVRAACKRHLDDLEHGHERGLVWDPEEAMRPIEFARFCKHSKGEWAGRPVELEPWQVFIVGCLFGWKREDGTRRFRKALIAVARKNGKSTLLSVLGLYLMIADGEEGPEVYAAATKFDQAKIVHGEAQRMVRASPGLSKHIKSRINRLYSEFNNGVFLPLGRDSDTLDGLNVHGAIIDELHAHDDSGIFDVLSSAMGARRQPLLVSITTAGFNPSGFGAEEWEYVANILKGTVENDSYFGFIATLDEGDDPFDESVWVKANPNLGVSVSVEYLREQAQEAQQAPHKLNNFLVKHINKWTTAHTPWMPMDAWAKCSVPVAEEELRGLPCYLGIDLSATTDLTAMVALFPPTEDCEAYRVLAKFYLPEDNLREKERTDRVPYQAWVNEKHLTLTPGNVIDYDWIRADLDRWASAFKVLELGYDRYNATQFIIGLEQDGYNTVPVSQQLKDISAPTKRLLELVLSGRIRVGTNPVLRWMAGNVVVYTDSSGNIKPDKKKSRFRIDGIVALVMAIDRAMRQMPTESVYERRGMFWLEA